jgi:hypothetical protein
MRHPTLKKALLVSWLLLIPTAFAASAQDTDPNPPESPTRYSLSFGLGPASGGLGWRGDATIHHSGGEFILRAAGSTDTEMFKPNDSVSDVGFLFGLARKSPNAWVRVAAGPSFVWEKRATRCRASSWFFCAEWDMESSSSLGLATQVDTVWAPWSWAGFGVTLFGDVNSSRSFGGVTLSLFLGGVR